MKKYITVLCIALTLCITTQAQQRQTVKKKDNVRTGKLMQQNMNDPNAINPAKNNEIKYDSGNEGRERGEKYDKNKRELSPNKKSHPRHNHNRSTNSTGLSNHYKNDRYKDASVKDTIKK